MICPNLGDKVLANNANAVPFGGHVFVERDGQYQLEPLENINSGDFTYWGVFQDITLRGHEFYYSFMRTIWDKNTETYERKTSLIAANSLVHPRAIIHADVIIEAGAVVQDGAELLEGARLKKNRGVSAGQKYHHLMANVHLVANSATNTVAVSPKTEASKPNPHLADDVQPNTHPFRQYLESH
jgi:hypothetical protein